MPDTPRFEILDYRPTPLGVLCLRRRELLSRRGTTVTEVTLDGEFLMSSLYTASERALTRHALELHGGEGLDVLVGGLGLGYTAREALDSGRVRRVEVVEVLPEVLDWLERGLTPLAAGLRSDPRCEVRLGDVFADLAGSPARRHDVIALDVDHSPDEPLRDEHLAFYRPAGLRRAREHLRPGGVLAVWSSAASEPFVEALGEVFEEARVETVDWRNELIDREQTDRIFLARRSA